MNKKCFAVHVYQLITDIKRVQCQTSQMVIIDKETKQSKKISKQTITLFGPCEFVICEGQIENSFHFVFMSQEKHVSSQIVWKKSSNMRKLFDYWICMLIYLPSSVPTFVCIVCAFEKRKKRKDRTKMHFIDIAQDKSLPTYLQTDDHSMIKRKKFGPFNCIIIPLKV